MTRVAVRHTLRSTSRRTFLYAAMAVSAVAALLPGRPAHADALANIQKAGVIRVAIPNDFPPVSYTHLTLPTTSIECRSRWSPYH